MSEFDLHSLVSSYTAAFGPDLPWGMEDAS